MRGRGKKPEETEVDEPEEVEAITEPEPVVEEVATVPEVTEAVPVEAAPVEEVAEAPAEVEKLESSLDDLDI